MTTTAERIRSMRARRRQSGLREVRLVVPDARAAITRERIAAQVARLTPVAEREALDWIEGVSPVDRLVLGTVNGPWKRNIEADELAAAIVAGQGTRWNGWLVHVATFFCEVRQNLIWAFADQHGINSTTMQQRYHEMWTETGERNPDLEAAFDASEN